MKNLLLLLCLISGVLQAQTIQQLKDSAAVFPPMPRGTVDMIPFVSGFPTFASGAPFNDLDFTLLDTDYMDGENSGSDVFMPVDPSDNLPGANKIKYIRCILNTDLNEAYGSANADRIILGTHEIASPFFLRGGDGIDNDYAVIQHLDFESGYIQLKGSAIDYSLIYCTVAEGCETEGWYLFYTANNVIDLIAFIFPCWDIEPSVSGNPPNNLNPICNSDSTLSLNNPNHFKYAQPINTTIQIPESLVQFGTSGKEIIGGMTADNFGNSYVFGCTDGNLDGATDAENELFVVKFDVEGNHQWVTELGLAEGSILKDGIADDNFLYVCGRTLGELPGFTNQGKWDGILLKLDLTTGAIVNSQQWGNPGIDGYGNITQDDAGSLFVSAQGSPANQGGTDDLYLVAKHSKADLSMIWRELNPPNATGFIASAEAWGGLTYVKSDIPGDGSLIAGGWYFSNLGANAFVSVYENLMASNPTRTYSEIINTLGAKADWVLDNAVDSHGNIYVAGFTTGNLGALPSGEGDAFVMKFSPQLTNPTYAQFGTNKSDLIRKLLIQNDTLYAIGYTYGNYAGSNADPTLNTGDILVQKLDTNLNLLEAKQFGTPHEERAFGFIRNNDLIIGGMTEGYLTGNNQGSFDGFLTLLSSSSLNIENTPSLNIVNVTNSTQLNIYPNPTSGWLTIESEINENASLKLFDVFGKQIQKVYQEENRIDLSPLPQGVYYLKLEFEDKKIIKKIIKN